MNKCCTHFMHPCRQDQHTACTTHRLREHSGGENGFHNCFSQHLLPFFSLCLFPPHATNFFSRFFSFFLFSFVQSQFCTFCVHALHCSVQLDKKKHPSCPSLPCFLVVFSPRKMVLRLRVNVVDTDWMGKKGNGSSHTMTFFDFCSLFVVLFNLQSKQKRIPIVYLLKTKDVRKL